MEKLVNLENEYNHEMSCTLKQGPAACISIAEVIVALKQMQAHRAAAISAVVAEMLKVTADSGIQWRTAVFDDLVRKGCTCICSDQQCSALLQIFKGNGDLSRGTTFLEHAMKG